MRTIKLTQGQVALVDDCDYERLAKHKWYALKARGGKFYAARKRSSPTKAGRKTLLMHRVIFGLRSRRKLVDHKDHDTLNNVRENIRACTHAQNLRNRLKRDGFKGITLQWTGKYTARIQVGGKVKHLGTFVKPEDAARVYDKAAIEYFGQFACTNFPEAA
jgi:hypothetical protein